jgi:hypothetical protein
MVFENTPVVKSSKTLPDWWKQLPRSKIDFVETPDQLYVPNHKTISNMRNCYGFLEFYKKGLVIENWTDLAIKITKDNYKYYCTTGERPAEHNREQYGKGFKNYHHIKLASPWHFKEKTGVQFLFVESSWSLEDYDFKIVPGVVNFTWNTGTNINIMLPKKDAEYVIPVGLPLMHIIPLSDKTLEHKNHLVTSDELDKIISHSQSSLFGWRKMVSLKKRNEERKSECPFGS